MRSKGKGKIMDKKEMKQIEITDVIVHRLSRGQDITDEWTSDVNVDFIIDKPQTIKIFDKTYVIDRIKMLTHWGDEIVFRLSTEDFFFEELEVSKIFVHKIYNMLDELQSENNVLHGWNFKETLFEILSDDYYRFAINAPSKTNVLAI